jgi:hypothetical protein
MIRIDARGAVYGEVWYEEEPPAGSGVDIVVHQQRENPIAGARTTPFLSLMTDLSEDESAIMGRFGKDCTYKVRRAETKDGLQIELILEPQSRLQEFRGFYDSFARQKSLQPCDSRWLAAACDAGQLALTLASRNGEPLVWHAYVVFGKTARLQYTASCFRDRENDYRALVGRANRWLHWKEMLRFKQIGLERLDWGGLFDDDSRPEHAGVNKFKKEFGGRQVRSYNCTVPVTVRGRVYLPLSEAWRRLSFS